MDILNENLSGPRLPLRIALLRGDDYHNQYLERLLSSEFNIVCVVSEPGRSQLRDIWKRRRWHDAGAAEYHRLRRIVFGKNRYRRRYFSPDHDGFRDQREADPVLVDNINEPLVQDRVRQAGADICVITCTTRLSANTIRGVGVPIVNIHGGHLPDFRGCHCIFSALTERRFDAIGSTIHFVDVGLDTGDIIEVVRPRIRPSDDAERLYSRAERLAAQRLVALLHALEEGVPLPRRPQPFCGRLILRRDRTPLNDIRHWLERRSGRLVIPDVDGPLPEHPWETQISSGSG